MSFTRNYGAPKADRDSTVPRFHMEAVEDPIATARAGRPIFRQEERVQFIQPGNPNSPVMRVGQEHVDRWPAEYEAFRRGEELTANGTPLEQWPFLRKNHVLELKALGINTVEQCAGLSDLQCQNIGMGGREIRENAKAYLDDAAAMAIVSESLARAEKAEADNANLQKQIDELREMNNRMFTDLQAMRNAPAPEATHIPGMADPIQAAMQAAPAGPVAESSLAGLAPRRQRVGRQPADA